MEHTILFTAAAVALIHTVLGPDHYIPFVALARSRNWSPARTATVTFLCGVGHVGSSVLIGLVGIYLGTAMAALQWVEKFRGDIAGWLLLCFGLVYTVWGLKRAISGHGHSHLFAPHTHSHDGGPEHSHPAPVTPWALFIIFVLGPCEPLIPVLVYPALKTGLGLAMGAALVFSVVTIATMLASVFLLLEGIQLFPVHKLERYAHALAGFAIYACGVAVKAGL
jgi:sulfite exporter TauE/SafE